MGKDKFIAEDVVISTSQCMSCQHFSGEFKCLAYPDGIPVGIAANKFIHDKPLLGDRGYQYLKKDLKA